MTMAENIGNRLRKKRKEFGLSQTDIAKRMSISQPAVARMEAGKQNFSVDMLERYVKALGVNMKLEFSQ